MKYVVKLKKEIERVVVIDAKSDKEADELLLQGKYEFSTERILTNSGYSKYLGYDYISHKTSDVVITSEQDLKDYFNTDNIEKMVFKYTECGCCYFANKDYVSVAGYAEGSGDVECLEHRLYFPFTIEEWNDELTKADKEGCDIWHEYNDGYDDEEEVM